MLDTMSKEPPILEKKCRAACNPLCLLGLHEFGVQTFVKLQRNGVIISNFCKSEFATFQISNYSCITKSIPLHFSRYKTFIIYCQPGCQRSWNIKAEELDTSAIASMKYRPFM